MLAVVAASELYDALGWSVPLRLIFKHRTVADVTAQIHVQLSKGGHDEREAS